MTHEEMFAASPIKMGRWYKFNYPEGFTSLKDYSEHRGVMVQIMRPARENEAEVVWDTLDGVEQIIDRMFIGQAEDGWIGHVWESELQALDSV